MFSTVISDWQQFHRITITMVRHTNTGFAARISGLIPVTTDYLSTFYRYNIRSISWYTLVGRELYGQLPAGRIEPVLANHPDITLRDFAGIKVLKSAACPKQGTSAKIYPWTTLR